MLLTFVAIGKNFGQSIFTNPITGTNPNASNPYEVGQIVDSNILVNGISRGSGITGSNANNRYTATGWNSTSLDTNDYFEFKLAPNSGYKISFSNFTYTSQASGTGPINFALRSNLDGFSSDIGVANVSGTTIDLLNSVYQNLTSEIIFRLYAWNASGSTGNFSVNDFTFNGEVLTTDLVDYCNLQFPYEATISAGSSMDAFAQVYESDITNFSGQGAGISSWIGYSSTNSNPNSSSWTWIPAIYNVDVGNNDEYKLSFGNSLAPGTYFYASRFKLNGGSYSYGGFNGGFWNGTSNVSGILTVNDTKVDYCNLQTPANGNVLIGDSFNVYAQVYEAGVTPGTGTQGSGIEAWIGFSTANTNPSSAGWTWISATFNPLGGGSENDEYVVNLGGNLTLPGTYYYASRFKQGLGTYSYGGILSNGINGNFWDGSTYISGILNANTKPEINIKGNSVSIPSNSLIPTETNHTDFTSLAINNTRTFIIENSGTAALSGISVNISGANASDFAVTTLPSTSVIGIGSTPFTITFTPSANGLRTASVSISNNDSDENPYVFAIQGYGATEIMIHGTLETNNIVSGTPTVSSLNNTNFGTGNIGESIDKIFTIKNTGSRPLNLTGIFPYVQISGADASDFSLLSSPASAVVFPNSSQSFTIRFIASGTGFRNAVVSILNSDSDENPFTFAIQGRGKEAEIDVRGNMISIASGNTAISGLDNTLFANTNIVGSSTTNTFMILNYGDGNLLVANPIISGADASDFSVTILPASIVASDSGHTNLAITFDPSSIGEKNAIVTILNSDLDENPYTFSIQGNAINYIECESQYQSIGIQNFEDISAVPNWQYFLSGSASVATGTAYASSLDSGNSLNYIGEKSFQFINSDATVSLNTLNTQAFSEVELSLRIGAYSVTSHLNGMEADDYVLISISEDGISWSDEIKVSGNSNAKWSFSSGIGIASSTYDNNNTVEASKNFAPSSGGYAVVEGYSLLKLKNLPSVANLGVKIRIKNNSAEELWAIDNIILKGKRNTNKLWNGTNWINSMGMISIAPTSSEIAIVNADYNSSIENTGFSACKCEINLGKTVTIAPTDVLDIQSDLINNGTIIIENNGSLVQHNDFATNTGIITMKRNSQPMYRYDFTYWSSPLTMDSGYKLAEADLLIPSLSPATLFDKFFKWNATSQAWNTVSYGNEIMIPGKGYIVRAPQNFSTDPMNTSVYQAIFKGKQNNGQISVPIIGGIDKWNLIGNPYPSAISADLFLSNALNSSSVDGTIYLWTHNSPASDSNPGNQTYNYTSDDYASYNFSGGTSTADNANSEQDSIINMPNGFIAAGQSFFIKGTSNGNAMFNNSMRSGSDNNQFFRQASGQNTTQNNYEKHRIWLNISNIQGAFNQALIGYIENATNGLDRGFDGEVLGGNYVTLYSIAQQKNLTIQGRALPFSVQDEVVIGFKTTVSGSLKIGIDHFDGLFGNQNIYLEDKSANVIHDLKQSDYEFTSDIGTFNSRFVLRYTDETLGIDRFPTSASGVIVSSQNKSVNVISQHENIQTIMVFDLLGRMIYKNNEVNSTRFSINEITQNQQILLVKVQLANGVKVDKKVIFN